jgi:hypothetical protein
MRGFYQQPKWSQVGVASLLALSFLGLWLGLLACLPLWLWALLFPLCVFHFMLAMTPWLRWGGIFIYHSAMLRAFTPRGGVCDLHTGTVFDYVANFGWNGWGPVASRKIMASIVEGLAAIGEEIQAGRMPAETRVQLTSYFVRAETLRRYGFRTSQPDRIYWFNSVLSLFNIVLMYCYARGSFGFPALHHAQKAVISGPDLVKAIPAMRVLARRLERECRTEGSTATATATAPVSVLSPRSWPTPGGGRANVLPGEQVYTSKEFAQR